MPGIVGFSCNGLPKERCVRALEAMTSAITHRDGYAVDDPFCDDAVCAGRAHTRIFNPGPQPAVAGDVHVWLDGEIVNHDELAADAGVVAESDPALLAALYAGEGLSFLRRIDGYYTAVIYDAARGLVHLAADRYGFRHVYWTERGGRFAWASELKALADVPDMDIVIDPDAVEEFLRVGQFLNDRTWFSGVELIPQGEVVTWNAADATVTKTPYWSYDEVKQKEPAGEEELLVEWERLFRRAVERRCRSGRIGSLLSGGLDSRAVVAAIPPDVSPLHLLTFGKSGSDDVEIARRVAAVRGAVHHAQILGADNWLKNRFRSVWWTDGQINLIEIHGSADIDERPQWFDVNVSGFIGDLSMGGSYIVGIPRHEIDALKNRVRRFTCVGLRNSLPVTEVRLPFADNDLLVFSLEIPDRLRKDHVIYNRLLLKCFPDYFRSIPWQKTGRPITWGPRLSAAAALWSKAQNELRAKVPWLGPGSRHFISHDQWIRQEPARSLLGKLIENPDALYPEYVDADEVRGLWRRHLAGEKLASRVGLHATFEVWLQQLFNREYRSGPSLDPTVTT